MYVINKKILAEPLKLTVREKDSCVGLGLVVLCLTNMRINERDDIVFYKSNCRGDYTTNDKCKFDSSHYRNISQWRNQTFPMSKDGAVQIKESFDEDDYDEYVELQLSELDPEYTELLICVSGYDEHFSLNDMPSLNISLWRKNYVGEPMSSYSEWEIANDNDLWEEYNGRLDSYDINISCSNSNAAVLGIIRRTNDQFILEPYFIWYKNMIELVNDY